MYYKKIYFTQGTDIKIFLIPTTSLYFDQTQVSAVFFKKRIMQFLIIHCFQVDITPRTVKVKVMIKLLRITVIS